MKCSPAYLNFDRPSENESQQMKDFILQCGPNDSKLYESFSDC